MKKPWSFLIATLLMFLSLSFLTAFSPARASAEYSQWYSVGNDVQYGPRDITVNYPANPFVVQLDSNDADIQAAPYVQVNPTTWIKGLSNNTEGKVYIFEPGTYASFQLDDNLLSRSGFGPYNNNVFLGKDGAIWDGLNTIQSIMRNISAGNPGTGPENVQIINLTIQNYVPLVQWGDYEYASAIFGGKGWVVVGNIFKNNNGALNMGRNWLYADNARITDNYFLDNLWQAVYVNGTNYIFKYNELARNGKNNGADDCNQGSSCYCWYSPIKFTDQPYDTFTKPTRAPTDKPLLTRNKSYDNKCTGLWLDVFVENADVTHNYVTDNSVSGIAVEISKNTKVYGNTVKNNGVNRPSGWGSGIGSGQIALINAGGSEVFGNDVEISGEGGGLGIIYEDHRNYDGTNIQIKGNRVTDNSTSTIFGGDSNVDFTSFGWDFDCNKYITSDIDKLMFKWDQGILTSFATFVSRGEETNGRIGTSETTLDPLPSTCDSYINKYLFDVAPPTPTPTPTPTPAASSSPSSTSSTTATADKGEPDLKAGSTGIAFANPIVAVVEFNSFAWDSDLSVVKIAKTKPFRLPGTNYWQASPVYEVWFKAFANGARILPKEVRFPFILALKYNPFELEASLVEKNLKLAYSADDQKTWKVLRNSVLDLNNHTVALITKNGGHYMLVSGYPR